MATTTSLECALLVTKNPLVRGHLRLERGTAPLVCLDSISAACTYQNRYKDASIIFIDSSLLIPGSSGTVEEVVGSIRPGTKIVYLVTSLEMLKQAELQKYQLFKLLEIDF